MNIAYLSNFYPFRGGIAQFNGQLYKALRARHSVTAFNFSRQYPGILFPGKTQYVGPGDAADTLESIRILDSINPISYFRTAAAVNRTSPDLLLISFWMPFFGPALGTVARRMKAGTKIVSILHNVIPHEPRFFDSLFMKYFLRPAHGFVVMNAAAERDLQSLSPGARCLRVPHPLYVHYGGKIDPGEARRRLGIPPGKRVLLFFGFIREYKGLDILIEAFGRLDDRYVLLIAGEAYGGFDAYDALIARSPLRENILVFNDYIPDTRIPEFFSAADTCVLPYRTATQSGITTIAYHFDLPVIVTDVGGLGEDVAGRGTGLVVGAPEPGAVAAGIRKYFDGGMKPGCVANIAPVKEEGSWSGFAEKLTEFARSL